MRRAYLDTSCGQIHYYTLGEGPPLFLLHATPRSGRIFHRIAPLLAGDFQVFAFDTPGFGNSDPLPASVSIDGLACAFLEAMDGLGLPRAHVLGYHTGNKIAASMAAQGPQRVDRLVLVGMSHSLVLDQASRAAAIHTIVDKVLHQQEESPGERLRRWATLFSSLSEACWRPQVVGKPDLSEGDLADLQAEVLDRVQAWKSVDAIYRANFDFDFQDALERAQSPTLVLEFATSGETHLRGGAHGIAQVMRQACASVLDDTDRSVWENAPGRVAQEVLRFLSDPHPCSSRS